jgi:tetratricopeptide (TPR) repeat protein
MPEPISTLAIAGLGWVAGSAVGGVVEGASGQAFSGIVRATKDRIAGLRGAPESQDVARAVRIAQMQALERVIQDFQVARPERFGALFARPGDFFERSKAFCADAIGRSTNPSVKLNLGVTPALASAIDGLLAPPAPGGPADQHAQAIAALAEDAVLDELGEVLDGIRIPDGFEEHFRNGSRSKLRFLDLFAIYITEQIKENQSFRAVLNSVQLAHIESLAFDARELATRIEERFGAALGRVESKVDVVGADVRQVGADLHSIGAQILGAISTQKGVPPEPLQAILERFGEEGVPLDQIPERLAAKADELLALREQWTSLATTNPDLADVQRRALALIDEGDLPAARNLLSEARQGVRASRHDRSKEEAALLAREAEIDTLEIRYIEAATKYREAAGLLIFDHHIGSGYLYNEARVLGAHGVELGDNASLKKAVSVLGEAAALKPRSVDPRSWAMIQNELGNVLANLGERESGTERLEEAVAAYRAALEELTREREPLYWATIQNNLGNALARHGRREGSTERLHEAVEAYRAALAERTQDRVPLDWAATQNNLGNALSLLGERENRTGQLKEAVEAYRAALQERTRERMPLNWAMTQNNLGIVLMRLGERESGTERLEEAVLAHRAALEERTRERVPLYWATTQNNLGNALTILGERENRTERLELAVAAYRAALEERTRDRVPMDWAMTQNNLGTVLKALGERESGAERLEEAVTAYRAALEEFENAGASYYVRVTQANLARISGILAQRRNQSRND